MNPEPEKTWDVIVLDDIPVFRPEDAPAPKNPSALLLNLCSDENVAREVESFYGPRYGQFETRSAAGLLDETALRLREDYCRFVAEAADTIRVGGKTLREAFVFENFSLWWINEIFGKRSCHFPTFTRVCQLEILSAATQERKTTALLLLTESPPLAAAIASFCDSRRLELATESLPRAKNNMPRLARDLAGSLAWFFSVGIQTLVSKIARLGRRPAAPLPRYAFQTWYNTFWPRTPSQADIKWGGHLEVLRNFAAEEMVCACSLSADGFHPSARLAEALKIILRWRKNPVVDGLPVTLLDASLSCGDFFRAFARLKLLWQYHRVANEPAFRNYWTYRGASIFPFIEEEWLLAAKRTPRYLLHALRTRRFLSETKPRAFSYHMFELGIGRALCYAVKSAGTATKAVGVQEGPLAKRKIESHHVAGERLKNPACPEDFVANLPVPDAILVEGDGVRDLLLEAGYAENSVRVVGAPRVSKLNSLPAYGSALPPERSVLVAFGMNDTFPILNACLPILRRRTDFKFLFKMHPRSMTTPEKMTKFLDEQKVASPYAIEAGDVYQALPKSRAVVATYSSVAIEALAKGYPLACLLLPNHINATPLLDIRSRSLKFVTRSEELEKALDDVMASPPDAEDARLAEKNFFYALDGESAGRTSLAIRRLAEES